MHSWRIWFDITTFPRNHANTHCNINIHIPLLYLVTKYGHLYIARVWLVPHRLAHSKQLSIVRVTMLLALLSFFLSFAWAWIPTINIISAFHLGFSHPYSYHHISYGHWPIQHCNLACIFFLHFLVFVFSCIRW